MSSCPCISEGPGFCVGYTNAISSFSIVRCIGKDCGAFSCDGNVAVNMNLSDLDIFIKKNTIAKDGLASISNQISIQPTNNLSLEINKNSLETILRNFSFLSLSDLKTLIDNLVVTINDYNTLSLPIFVKNELDKQEILSDIKIIEKAIKKTLTAYVINTLSNVTISDEVKHYSYKRLFDLLFYFLSLYFRLKIGWIIKTTVNVIKSDL
jgi:hypothetical protein